MKFKVLATAAVSAALLATMAAPSEARFGHRHWHGSRSVIVQQPLIGLGVGVGALLAAQLLTQTMQPQLREQEIDPAPLPREPKLRDDSRSPIPLK